VSDDVCTNPACGHSFDGHRMIAPGDPLQGGVMMCPVRGCPCWSTWSCKGTYKGGRSVEPEQPECGICFANDHRPYECRLREPFARDLMRRRDAAELL
jgi:hypothetical protein